MKPVSIKEQVGKQGDGDRHRCCSYNAIALRCKESEDAKYYIPDNIVEAIHFNIAQGITYYGHEITDQTNQEGGSKQPNDRIAGILAFTGPGCNDVLVI